MIKSLKTAVFLCLILIVTTLLYWQSTENNNLAKVEAASLSYNEKVNLLARAIHAEAEAEPYIGKVAVGAVLLNRVNNSQFPNTLSGVIYQSSALESVSNGRMNTSAGKESRKAAVAALNGWDPTYGSLFFWNPYKKVNKWVWTRQIAVQYGNHVFAK